MSSTQVFEQFRCFKKGQTSVENEAKSEERQELLAVFVTQDDDVHYEFPPESHTVDRKYKVVQI